MNEKSFELSIQGTVRLLATLVAFLLAPPLTASSAADDWELLREAEALIAGESVVAFINDQQLEDQLQKILAGARQSHDRQLEAATRIVFGRLRLSKGEIIGALAHFQLAHEHYRAARDRNGEARALQGIGEAYHVHGSYREAVTFLQEALALRRKEAASPGAEASIREALAKSYAAAGSYDEALRHLRVARETWKSLNDPGRSLKAGLSLGEVEYRAGRYRHAAEVLEVVARELTKLEAAATDEEIDAFYDEFFSSQEGTYRNVAKLARAAEEWDGEESEMSLPFSLSDFSPSGQSTTLGDETFMRRRMEISSQLIVSRIEREEVGRNFSPRKWSPLAQVPGIGRHLERECAELERKREDQEEQIRARLRADLPGVKESCWDFSVSSSGGWDCAESLRYLSWMGQTKTLTPAAPPECEAPSGVEGGVEWAATMRAAMQTYEEGFHSLNWLSLGPFAEFQEGMARLYRDRAAAREAACHYELATRVHTSLGRAYAQLGEYRESQREQTFSDGWQAAEKIWGGAALAGIGGAEQFRALKVPKLAPPPFQGCDRPGGIPGLAPFQEARPWRADLSLERGELAVASAFYEERLKVTTKNGGVPEHLIAALSGLAEAHLRQGMPALATIYYGKAVEIAESVHGELREEQIVSSFAGIQSPLYATLVDLLIDLGEADLAFAYAEKARARAFLNVIGQRPLDSERRPLGQEWDDARREAVFPNLRLEHLRDGLVAEGTTLVAYFNTPRRSLAWVVEAGKTKLVELPLAPSELFAVRDLRVSIAEKEVPTALAEKLYEGLFAPLRPYVRHRTLVLVPFGILHELPFAVLRDPSTGSYLIEDFDLTLLPSASALAYVQQRRNPWDGRALVLGDPDGTLANAGPEAERVAELYASTPRLGGEARERLVREAAGKIDVLHVAAHGRFDEHSPLSGYLALAGGDGEDPRDDGSLHVHEVLSALRFPEANLVVLSACDSSVGALSNGDDVVSMSRAFLSAGAPSVVSTLWGVDDEASKTLMIRFHRELQDGVPVSEALRRAQVEVSDDPETAAPYYWAGFTLTGDHLGRGETPQATRELLAELEAAAAKPDPPDKEQESDAGAVPSAGRWTQEVLSSLAGLRAPAERRGGVTLFEHKAFAGESETFQGDDPNLKDNDVGQDSATSVRVDTGCEVVLYQNVGYRGRSTDLTEDTENLRGTRVGNDEVSSLRVRCDD